MCMHRTYMYIHVHMCVHHTYVYALYMCTYMYICVCTVHVCMFLTRNKDIHKEAMATLVWTCFRSLARPVSQCEAVRHEGSR